MKPFQRSKSNVRTFELPLKFAIAYAAEILDGNSPMEAHFDVTRMREHLIKCLKNEVLLPFPKLD